MTHYKPEKEREINELLKGGRQTEQVLRATHWIVRQFFDCDILLSGQNISIVMAGIQ